GESAKSSWLFFRKCFACVPKRSKCASMSTTLNPLRHHRMKGTRKDQRSFSRRGTPQPLETLAGPCRISPSRRFTKTDCPVSFVRSYSNPSQTQQQPRLDN